MGEPVRVAMVGCGGRAGVHAPRAAASPKVEITAWLDVDRSRAEGSAEQYGGRVLERYEQALDDPAIEGVVIALPHDLHHEYGVAAGRAGKHILMEIPIAATPEQADEMIAAAERTGVVVLVLHSLRFWKSHQQIKALLDSGILGRPIFARYHNEHYVPADYFGRQPGHFAAEAGVLHHGDIMRWWVSEVEAVTACALMFEPESRGYGTFDHITVLYELAGGALGETTTSWVTRLCTENEMVRGSVSCEGGTVTTSWDGRVRIYSEHGRLPGGERFQVIEPQQPDGPDGEIVHFAECIRDGAAPLITPRDARRALELTIAARDSARERRRIELPALE
ncbi:MAG: Gfo/Idh/MocA family oxidoreductase [Armatimonadetes bacterium]|nr:Gfo/Idh/MocA family oxidoreductase [Armatimonadota bacterium]